MIDFFVRAHGPFTGNSKKALNAFSSSVALNRAPSKQASDYGQAGADDFLVLGVTGSGFGWATTFFQAWHDNMCAGGREHTEDESIESSTPEPLNPKHHPFIHPDRIPLAREWPQNSSASRAHFALNPRPWKPKPHKLDTETPNPVP